ncbi:MAG TPA: hypothetical protein VFW07_02810 [Parafilimonas sp.]|nr:hypothetical protein [Parafilimonas sp.]
MENLRTELHNMIDKLQEDKLQEVYELLQDTDYPDELKEILDNEFEEYKRTGEAVSKEEVDKIINAILAK